MLAELALSCPGLSCLAPSGQRPVTQTVWSRDLGAAEGEITAANLGRRQLAPAGQTEATCSGAKLQRAKSPLRKLNIRNLRRGNRPPNPTRSVDSESSESASVGMTEAVSANRFDASVSSSDAV